MTNDKGVLALDIFESPKAAYWLIEFWKKRDEVTPENQCPVVLQYEDGREEKCVIFAEHMNTKLFKAHVPHVNAEGRLAPMIVAWETIQAAQESKDV